ncbi:hypothetical protein HD601_005645 [Jiangella mangrovi]|uniref:Immunity protein 52 domain-containing protein n=1 Tax=Jiangella mangrovi TaxID=1524084 RepID=A0A7W9GVZ5_9ACTN|nr:hypothetical protein [Jiangella mangrovi]MBB5791070.1 hypothetical protein [Jiangella mangrovi]
MDLGETSLAQLLAANRNRKDSDGEIIEELGYYLGLWNGLEAGVGLMAKLGASHTDPGAMNHFVLELPPANEAPGLYRHETARAALDVITTSWAPDWATWSSSTLREAQGAPPRSPVLGWITFLSDRRRVDPDLSGVGVEKTHGGSLVTLPADVGASGASAMISIRKQVERSADLTPTP